MAIDYVKALKILYPNTSWTLDGDSYEGLNWLSQDVEKPSKEELDLEVQRIQSEYDALEYQRLRAKEYPDFKEYLDGIVKNDQEQINAYISKCIEIKEKYPKSGGI